jgi:hypothetical protein
MNEKLKRDLSLQSYGSLSCFYDRLSDDMLCAFADMSLHIARERPTSSRYLRCGEGELWQPRRVGEECPWILDLLHVGKIVNTHATTKWTNMRTMYLWSEAHHRFVDHAAYDRVSSSLVRLTEWNNTRGQEREAGVVGSIHFVRPSAQILSSSADVASEGFGEIFDCLLRRRSFKGRRSKSENGFEVVLSISEGGVVLVDLPGFL